MKNEAERIKKEFITMWNFKNKSTGTEIFIKILDDFTESLSDEIKQQNVF